MIEFDIAKGLLAYLEAFPFGTLPVEYPDLKFTTPDDGKYWTVDFFPNTTEALTLEDDGPRDFRGILQVSYVTTEQLGMLEIQTTVGPMLDYFRRGTEIRYGDAVVKIEQPPSLAPVIQDGHRALYPVSIRYRCSG